MLLDLFKKALHLYKKRRQLKWQENLDYLRSRYHIFRALLNSNSKAVDYITEISLSLRLRRDWKIISEILRRLISVTGEMVVKLDSLEPKRYQRLFAVHRNIKAKVEKKISILLTESSAPFCLSLDEAEPMHYAHIGNKAAGLADLKSKGRYQVPEGFIVTAPGCRHFLEYEGLMMKLIDLVNRNMRRGDNALTPEIAGQIQESIIQANIPPDLWDSLKTYCQFFFVRNKTLAVRSSSTREDGSEHSFAGQFATLLNVSNEEQFMRAFKEVVASSFNTWSMAYRIQAGLDPLIFDMAVLCLEMIPEKAAGIMLTRNPLSPMRSQMLISAVYGLGKAAAEGSVSADLYYLEADGVIDRENSIISKKEKKLVCLADGGIGWDVVPSELSEIPVLAEKEVARLFQIGTNLENENSKPLDIEWILDTKNELYLLQIRPLTSPQKEVSLEYNRGKSPMLKGIVAAAGTACGKVRLVSKRSEMFEQPNEPVIIVMHQSFVEIAAILPQVQGVLVELGSPLDHLAIVARENGIPMICCVNQASELLKDGQWLVIGENGSLFPASSDEIETATADWLKGAEKKNKTHTELSADSLELQALLTKLNLTDAYGPTFSILECKSLHDIIRFIHEMAVLSMFSAGDEILESSAWAVRTIEAPFPFIFSVIDIGGGLMERESSRKRIPPSEIISRPFLALWDGMTTPGLSWGPVKGAAAGSVMSNWLTDQKSERPVGLPNYAIIGHEYCNINARMDFHFTMIDAVCGLEPRNNHLKFRFKGGGTQMQKRIRRVRTIGLILEKYGFLVDIREDLVTGTLRGGYQEAILERLVVVGRLLGFTRLLDAVMVDDKLIELSANAFIQGDYSLSTLLAQGIIHAEKKN